MPDCLPQAWSTAVIKDKFDFTKKPRGLRFNDYPEIPFVPMDLVPHTKIHGKWCQSHQKCKSQRWFHPRHSDVFCDR